MKLSVAVFSLAASLVITGCQTSRIIVTNHGAGVIEVREGVSGRAVQLGPSGTGYFPEDSMIHIGDVSVSVGKRPPL